MLRLLSVVRLVVLSVAAAAPLRSCSKGAPYWKVWHALDASKATISGASKIAVQPSLDSSVVLFATRLANNTNQWTTQHCKKDCEVRFSPFGESCVSSDQNETVVRWTLERQFKRQVLTIIAVVSYLGADRLSEATSLHYGVGVCAGIAASLLVLVGLAFHFLGGGPSHESGRRVRFATFLGLTFGYARLVQRFVLGGIWRFVHDWPIACGVYVVVSASASVAGTRAVLRTGLVPDFVRTGARLVGLLLVVACASPSAVATVLLVMALVLSDYVAEAKWILAKASDLCVYAFYAALVVLAAFASVKLLGPLRLLADKANVAIKLVVAKQPIVFTPPQLGSSSSLLVVTTSVIAAVVLLALFSRRKPWSFFSRRCPVAGPPPNYLHGHRFLTDAEYKAQGQQETATALAALTRDPMYAQWLAQNHHRLAAPSPSKLDKSDDDDLDDDL